MPKNNELLPVKLPMKIRFGEKPTTKFVNNLESINIDLLEFPTMSDLRRYLAPFINATWAESPRRRYGTEISEKMREDDSVIRDALLGKALPTALETINLVFSIDGISLQEVTHILRYRTASFSADCSGDKWWTYKDALVPNSVMNSNGETWTPVENSSGAIVNKDDFFVRYQQIVKDAKQLYCDMIDSKKVSIMDARYILPRCLSTFYYMRISLRDALSFIYQRIDKQIQPETDNIIAYLMYREIVKCIPIAYDLVDIHAPSKFYASMARTGKATNLYFPDEDSDIFEWNERDFIYQCRRDEMNGIDAHAKNLFNKYASKIESSIKECCENGKRKLDEEYYRKDRKLRTNDKNDD